MSELVFADGRLQWLQLILPIEYREEAAGYLGVRRGWHRYPGGRSGRAGAVMLSGNAAVAKPVAVIIGELRHAKIKFKTRM